ncbi:hypothetical protein JAAARDRAFT_27690 [Jaapia argillacea MUCL 33604]|uniref:DUF6593 domain-containing protein n=1 Tax=Jaapia argillacea MUCL 33604 TaxID=933084 RepID=A0A067QKM1_9AGAM|nr:hypothetical protein JAAARDRAFT_27690 [Jaapia argillacea MUCL 33604]
MANTYVLLQFGSDPADTNLEDLEARAAFSISEADRHPNLVCRVAREAEWCQQHPDIMGPNNSFLYFGPANTPGYLVYGNGPEQPMLNSIRQRRDGSASRYFVAQNGREYKWKLGVERMELVDSSRTAIAVWEVARPEDEFFARLTLRHSALPIITEIMTTLTLNRMARDFNWG